LKAMLTSRNVIVILTLESKKVKIEVINFGFFMSFSGEMFSIAVPIF